MARKYAFARIFNIDCETYGMKLTNLPFQLGLAEELAVLEKTKELTFVNLANSAAKSFLITTLQRSIGSQNIFWASTDESSDALAAAAEMFFEGDIIEISKEITPKTFYSIRRSLRSSTPTLLLFEDFDGLRDQTFPTQEILDDEKVVLKKGESVQIFSIFSALETSGYRPAEEQILKSGEFFRQGESLFLFPANADQCIRITLFGDEIEEIVAYDQVEKKASGKVYTELEIFPEIFSEKRSADFFSAIELNKKQRTLFIADDFDRENILKTDFPTIRFTSFPQEDENFFHLNFFSVLPFYTIPDFVVDIKERFRRSFEIVIATKKFEELENIFRDNDIMFTKDLSEKMPSTVKVVELGDDDFIPHSFQNNDKKFLFLTDREIFQFHRSSRQKKAISGMNMDLMNSLSAGDYVIHTDHGLAEFGGIVRRDLGKDFGGVREYLLLQYANNDKLFVPVESAEKITKFIGDEAPRLTKLGASEWKKSQEKLKKETELIAKELLKLYAARELAKGKSFTEDDDMMRDFCDSFPYELTPGQAATWGDVKRDLEKPRPMDRLVCGDVGFGKTEIAMRTAFKTFRSGMQAAILAPITILAEQHYQSFKKRIEGKNYGVRVELLSRFQSAADQKKVLRDLEAGLVDIVIGTHRLLSQDIKFKNIGCIIIDEEQRFGVKQKEKLKRMRAGVDVLTMTATPIPRTLNMGLNKLKDISTITTPPPGRLPVVTEVRRYNLNLIRERILFETERGGQVYFLHNEVKTIESHLDQLQSLIPEVKFIVAHGQLKPEELEDRIRKFKEGEAQVLIASTIIENGIDLSNANTLIVNRAEKFGLSQLYQLRGRVGRSRTQAYAYFLYHGQKIELEAKKRLRAIVEASELGSGFQIAMRDLEIRGAGEVLGANQSGAMKSVGVSHFMRMLSKTVEEMKSGETSTEVEEEVNITVDIPLSAFIPTGYIPNVNEKIQTYQELASATDEEHLSQIKAEMREDYGKLPVQVENLCKVIRLKQILRDIHIEGVKLSRSSHKDYELVLRMGSHFTPDQIFGLLKNSQKKWVITAKAIKLKMENLAVSWYDDLVRDVQYLKPEKKK